jgi:ketosteroid isomerase-like protein
MSIEVISDRLEILDLIGRYAQSIDDADVDGIMACFTENAEFALHGGAEIMRGSELRDFFARILGWASGGKTMHLMGQTTLELQAGVASGRTTAVSFLNRSPAIRSVRGLRYRDTFVKVEAGWRIAKRYHDIDWQFDATSVPIAVVGNAK